MRTTPKFVESGYVSAEMNPHVFSRSPKFWSLHSGMYLLQTWLTTGLMPTPRGSQGWPPLAPHAVDVPRLYEMMFPAASRNFTMPARKESEGTVFSKGPDRG